MIGDGNPMEFGWTARDGTRWHHPPYGPARPERIRIIIEHPRSRWRRLLRLSARRSVRGPYAVRPWPADY